MPTAIARIECYKHYQAGAIHKEAVRELTNYKNPNYDPTRTHLNHYFYRMEMDKPFEKWIYDYREQNNIVGRYLEHSKNPKSETNAMCQAFFAIPNYIREFEREDQIRILGYCWDFFKQEFPHVPVTESVIHFDETEPHLQIDFLPVVEREHKKRGKEKIFSTTLLMPGKDFFPKFQDRFYAYMEKQLACELERKKGSKAKHLAPKEFRELTAEMKSLQQERDWLTEQVEAIRSECGYYEEQVRAFDKLNSIDRNIKLAQLQKENARLKSFISYLIERLPYIGRLFQRFRELYDREQYISFAPVAHKPKYRDDEAVFGPMNWYLQEELDKIFGTDFARKDKQRFFDKSR